MPAQAQLVEPGGQIQLLEFAAGQTFNPDQQQRQQATNDSRITGAFEAPLAFLLLSDKPDLALTAMHAVCFGLLGIAQGCQTLTPLHQQARPLLPASRLFEAVQCFLCFIGQAHRSSSKA
ncbi:hypothetical protein D3C79_807960 [compost metagenome]